MAERQYTPGLLDRLRGRDPNDPNPPKAPSKPTIDQARRTMMKERQDRLGAKTGDGNIYKNGAGTQQSAQRMGMPANKPSANAAVNTAVPNKRGPVSGATRGALGLPAQSTGQQTVRRTDLPKRSTPVATAKPAAKPVAKPTPKPMSAMAKLRADKDFMSTIEKDAAALRKPAQKAAPKAAASKKSSSNDAYDNYKRLMEKM